MPGRCRPADPAAPVGPAATTPGSPPARGPVPAAARARPHHWLTFTLLAAGVVGWALLQSLAIPVLPTIQAELQTSQNTVTWVLTAYLLSASVATPIIGRLGDTFGKRRMLVLTLAGLAAGAALAAVATSIGVMIVARAIQGVGGGVLPLAFGIIRDEFPSEKIAGAVGTIAALTAAGAGLGLVIAGPTVDVLGYHWLFWLPAIVLTVATVVTHLVVPESPVRHPGRISWVGGLLLTAWLVVGLIPISQAPHWGWGSPVVLGMLAGAGVLFAAWVWAEARSAGPLVDMRMMRIPVVWAANLVALLVGIALYASFAFLPQFMQTDPAAGYGFGVSITESGLIMLPSAAATFVLGTAAGRLAARFSAKAVLVAGTAMSVGTFVILTLWHDHVWQLLLAVVLQGCGFGLAFASLSALVVQGVPASQTGVASGMNANIRTIGGAIGAAVVSSIITGHLQASGLPAESSYTWGFAVLGLAAAGATVAACLVPVPPGRTAAAAGG